jgi:putative endonuclease
LGLPDLDDCFDSLRRSPVHYVYLLRSIHDPTRTYVGYTTDLRHRVTTHNLGGSTYTARYRPWRLVTYVAFSAKSNALGFERYLKSHSGMAFAAKRLW